MAAGTVGAKQGIQGFFEGSQRFLFVETIRNNDGFDVGSTASIGKL
jgi:hypothetical protein